MGSAVKVESKEVSGTEEETEGLITLEDVRREPQVAAFLRGANEQMKLLGYTEHGERHAGLVGCIAQNILLRLGYPQRRAQLAAISGYLHDIGNVIHRDRHAQSSASIAMQVLSRLGMDFGEIAVIIGALGNHEEERGDPISEISAAVIIADKADVHRSRVQNPDPLTFDIHDRVNYAAQRSFVRVESEQKVIALEIDIDTEISQVMEYFEIFMDRMLMSRRAVRYLGCEFQLNINGTRLF
ncbi:MAG: HD domain-containing protein [Anaerolineae bacterium]